MDIDKFILGIQLAIWFKLCILQMTESDYWGYFALKERINPFLAYQVYRFGTLTYTKIFLNPKVIGESGIALNGPSPLTRNPMTLPGRLPGLWPLQIIFKVEPK